MKQVIFPKIYNRFWLVLFEYKDSYSSFLKSLREKIVETQIFLKFLYQK